MDTRNLKETPHPLFVNQKVKDIKIPPNGKLEHDMGTLRRWLLKHSFIPGDKVTAALKPKSVDNGVLLAEIAGGMLSSDIDMLILQRFPLGLPDYDGPMDVESIFSKVPGAQIDDGGNIQNGIINVLLAVKGLNLMDLLKSRNSSLRITIASSSDPFARFPEPLAASLRQLCEVYLLEIPDRFAIQVPWEEEGRSGTLAIASEPLRTNKALQELIDNDKEFKRAFKSATCFVSSDPIFDQLSTHVRPGYVYVINASTAFRSLVAAESFDRGVILPMNNGEAADVCRLLLQRGLDMELNRISAPPFNSPLKSNGNEIDPDALHQLDESLDILMRYIPPHRSYGRPCFTYPVTFGPEGGLVISTGYQEIACFTSTPENEEMLIKEFSNPEKVAWDRVYEVGAGDSVATIIALFNAIDPGIFIEGHMEGREPQDRQLGALAGAIFVSSLGRIMGNFLVRTTQTHWSNIDEGAYFRLFDEVAKESLYAARKIVKNLHNPVLTELKKWGIRVVAWRPGHVAYPDRAA